MVIAFSWGSSYLTRWGSQQRAFLLYLTWPSAIAPYEEEGQAESVVGKFKLAMKKMCNEKSDINVNITGWLLNRSRAIRGNDGKKIKITTESG